MLHLTIHIEQSQVNMWFLKILYKKFLFSSVLMTGLLWWLSKEAACNAGDLGSIHGLGRSAGRGHGNPLQYSCLENPKDRGVWWATVHGVTKSWTQLSSLAQLQCLSYILLEMYHTLTRLSKVIFCQQLNTQWDEFCFIYSSLSWDFFYT